MPYTRREFITGLSAVAISSAVPIERIFAGSIISKSDKDFVIICNEDSNTLSVIDPASNTVVSTLNLTSFDEDPRPPFRFSSGGSIPTHTAMVMKPLYHGGINIHGAAPSPDNKLLACTGRGSSNVYLIDLEEMKVIGNVPNPQAGPNANVERLSSGILVGREPHEPTFSRNGKEIWVTLRGENRIAILDTERAIRSLNGSTANPIRQYVNCVDGPAQVWFSLDGKLAFVASQKTSKFEIIETQIGRDGFSKPKHRQLVDLNLQDPYGFTPFQKISPDGKELWFSHKLADSLSAWTATSEPRLLDTVSLGSGSRPNHIEFVENERGRVIYASLARVDDGAPNNASSSQIAIVDRSSPNGSRRVSGMFFSHGREAHGLWTNPENTMLYVAHEQDELPNTPNEGQTVCSVFDVSNPISPKFVTQIPLGELVLPSGKLRNKKSINLVYVRQGARSQTG